MRKKNLKTYAVAAALSAAAFVGVPASTAYAEEAEAGVETIEAVTTEAAEETTEAVTTEVAEETTEAVTIEAAEETTEAVTTEAVAEETTEAVTTEAVAEETTEAVTTEAVEEAITADTLDTVEATEYFDGGSQNYNININGGSWDGTYYKLSDGRTVKNAFFCDGTYTYYLQNDGTPMKDRLTYHPDGEADHVIYFDSEGHEVFNNFANVKTSIEGEAVDDLCFFGSYGYMYVNKLTYNQDGSKLYYVNPYGVIERNGWFQFAEEIENIDGNMTYKGTTGGSWGCANADGTLMTSQWVYNWTGGLVYLQGDGSLATGMQDFGGTYYFLDSNDGHLIQTYSQKPETYTTTTYYADGSYNIAVYSGTITNTYSDGSSYDVLLSSDTYDASGNLTDHATYTYDSYGNETSSQFSSSDGSNDASTTVYLYHENGKVSYSKSNGTVTYADGEAVLNADGETYTFYKTTGSYTYEAFYNENGVMTASKTTNESTSERGSIFTSTYEHSYDVAGNLVSAKDSYNNTEPDGSSYGRTSSGVYMYDESGALTYTKEDITYTDSTYGDANYIEETYYSNGVKTGSRETTKNGYEEYGYYEDGETVRSWKSESTGASTTTWTNEGTECEVKYTYFYHEVYYNENGVDTYYKHIEKKSEKNTVSVEEYGCTEFESVTEISRYDSGQKKTSSYKLYDANGKLLNSSYETYDENGNMISFGGYDINTGEWNY